MSHKRAATSLDDYESLNGRLNKKPSTGTTIELGKPHNPITKYRNHKDSGVGEDFHYVPYPLSLMPYDSWYMLHHQTDLCEDRQFVCPKCKKPRPKPTSHQRKLFLVAERLSWGDGTVPSRERATNEEQLWQVNFELGIAEPAVDDLDQQPGGRESLKNPFFPFETEDDMEAAMALLANAESLSENSYHIWRTTLGALPGPSDLTQAPLIELSAAQMNAVNGKAQRLTPAGSSSGREGRSNLAEGRKRGASGSEEPEKRQLAVKGLQDPTLRPVLDHMSRDRVSVSELRQGQDGVNEVRSNPPNSLIGNLAPRRAPSTPILHQSPTSDVCQSGALAYLAEGAQKHPINTTLMERNVCGDAAKAKQQASQAIEDGIRYSLRTQDNYTAISQGSHASNNRREVQKFHVRWMAEGKEGRGELPFEELSLVICNRLEELVRQRPGEAPLALRRVKEGIADKLQQRTIQLLTDRICDDLINQQTILAQELDQARRIQDITIHAGCQLQFPQTAQQAGGVIPNACHLILSRAFFDPLLDRLLLSMSTEWYTARERDLFWEVIGLFEWFVHASKIDQQRAGHELITYMKSINEAILKAFQMDPHFRLATRRPEDILRWSPNLAQVASLRPDLATRASGVAVLPVSEDKRSLASQSTPRPSTMQPEAREAPPEPPLKSRRPFSVETLSEFYSLLDKIERTSYVASKYLEAYAEFLNRDVCNDCWYEGAMLVDDDFEALDELFGFFVGDKEDRMEERKRA